MRAAMRAALVLSMFVAAPVAFAQDKPEPEYPEFGEVVKDMTTEEGFIRLHRRQKDETLLAAIPPALVGQPFFFATSVSGGSDFAGWQWEDKLVRLEQRAKQLLLIEVNTRQRASKGDDPLAEVVKRTYADRLLSAIDIKTIAPDGAFVIDFGALLAGEYGTFFGGAFALNPGVARFVKAKAFPLNDEIAVQM